MHSGQFSAATEREVRGGPRKIYKEDNREGKRKELKVLKKLMMWGLEKE